MQITTTQNYSSKFQHRQFGIHKTQKMLKQKTAESEMNCRRIILNKKVLETKSLKEMTVHWRKRHSLRTLHTKMRLPVGFCADRQGNLKNHQLKTMKVYQNSWASNESTIEEEPRQPG